MRENEFEQLKQELLAKLPEYLKSKGINTNTNFRCLNPSDNGTFPSMSYDNISHTVKCVHCNAQYNIFDLIGIDFNIRDFAHQFIKVHELYIGKVSIGVIEALKQNKTIEDLHQKTPFELSPPHFEIADDFNRVSTFSSQSSFGRIKEDQPRFGEDSDFLLKTRNPFQTSSNDTLEKPPFSADFSFEDIHNTEKNTDMLSAFTFSDISYSSNESDFAKNTNLSFISDDLEKHNCTDYLNRCTENIIRTDYFKQRGISDSVIRRFRLGFDDNFLSHNEKARDLNIFKAAIIPYGMHGYCARNINSTNNNDRYIKNGEIGLFNKVALEQPGKIFITEGEIDALSIETLGYRAVALGGAGNIRQAIGIIAQSKENHFFYICPDNDEPGLESAHKLYQSLSDLNIPCKIINIATPYKDINEALMHDAAALKAQLDNIEKIINTSFDKPNFSNEETLFISNNEDINTLNISNEIYTISGNAQSLRYLVADIVKAQQTDIIYVAKSYQCRYLTRALSSATPLKDTQYSSKISYLEISENNVLEEIEHTVNSQIVLNEANQRIVLDLTSFDNNTAINILEQVASDNQKFSKGIVVLCSSQLEEFCSAVSLQNLAVENYEKNQLVIKTLDKGILKTFARGLAE